jgi:hypothetical protein
MPNNYLEPLAPSLRAHRNSFSGLANYDLVSPVESAISNPDFTTAFDEPPPPYPNNVLFVNNSPSDGFSPSAVVPTDSLLSIGSIVQSPLAPVPLRHSSLYHVLKQESPNSPAQGTRQSRASSIAHALEPQELQGREVPLSCTPAVRHRQNSTIGRPQLLLNIEPAAVEVETSPALPQLPVLDLAPPAEAQAQDPVSSDTPPCVAPVVPAQDSSVVTPLEAHTLADSLPDVTTHDYDTVPRLRKVSVPCPFLKCRT